MSKNRLTSEKSPYLLQHAQNPVDWFPWSEEAFAVAQATNRPIFLSVGYSTCHWCHVMAHESFESPEIARLLNELFINVKVDREERPDVDRIYMAFIQATTGAGGWPMSVWLTPQGQPFFGGTYFPPIDQYGRPGFPRVLQAIGDLWKSDPKRAMEHGRTVFAALEETSQESPSKVAHQSIVSFALDQFAATFDSENGGFGDHPKFPRASTFELLLRCSETDPDARHMALFSLRKIALGGIYDHLGGGFHRYSVDEFWCVPHFEKMLYDQAQLAIVFTQAFQLSKDTLFSKTALHTLEYMSRDLSDGFGGFYSAEDADSEIPDGSGRHTEGAFYLWPSSEVLELLGSEAGSLFCRAYNISKEGNAPESGDPHREFKGFNILYRPLDPQKLAEESGVSLEEMEKLLAESREKLYLRRQTRPRPHLDDKVLVAWNGLAISAFARAGIVFQQESLVKRAVQAVHFLRTKMWKKGQLLRSWRHGASAVSGFAADYAFLIQGLLDLYEAEFYVDFLLWALELQAVLDREFWDEVEGSYFENPGQDLRLPRTIRDRYDGAEPAANSVCALNLFRLARMFCNAEFEKRGERILSAFLNAKASTNLPFLLSAVLFKEAPPEEIVIAGQRNDPRTRALQYAIRRQFRPNSILLLADGAENSKLLARTNPKILQMTSLDGKPAAYICKNYTCQAPVTELFTK